MSLEGIAQPSMTALVQGLEDQGLAARVGRPGDGRVEQAMAAAGNLLGDATAFTPVPYFWTDQHDTRIQAYGIFPPDAEMRILYGDPSNGHFAATYGHRRKVVGALGWNAPRQVRTLRRLVVDRTSWAAIAVAGSSPPNPWVLAGLVGGTPTIGFLAAGPVSAARPDRWGAQPFAVAGCVVTAASFAGLLTLPTDFPYGLFAALVLLDGLGNGLFTAPNTTPIARISEVMPLVISTR
ncbi:oxidoreductase C-terminal domain-containing protein [Streptomyces yokosukanensis]|uniref:oxidoreductase C-terminal domain-containing protein n=1 Tax=Streptomyces yokosukanensis TaxID=67386 RepID=UPI003413D031